MWEVHTVVNMATKYGTKKLCTGLRKRCRQIDCNRSFHKSVTAYDVSGREDLRDVVVAIKLFEKEAT